MDVLRNPLSLVFRDGHAGVLECVQRDNEEIVLEGWSLCIEASPVLPPARIFFVNDGTIIGESQCAVSRPDVCARHSIADTVCPGFSTRLRWQGDAASIQAMALSTEGHLYALTRLQASEQASEEPKSFGQAPFVFKTAQANPFFPFIDATDRRAKIFSILACPQCRKSLHLQEKSLVCACGESFSFHKDCPVFAQPGNVLSHTNTITNPYSPKSLHLIASNPQALILDFGAGYPAEDERYENVIRQDFCCSPAIDVVSQTYNLPFHDSSFDHIISESVFEHVDDPWHYAEELYRVVKKDGYVLIDVAFMQPIHMDFHYYNMTLSGLKKAFNKFAIVREGVESYQSASQALNILLRNYGALLENEKARQELDLLGQIDFARYDRFISDAGQLQCAAGVFIIAQKH